MKRNLTLLQHIYRIIYAVCMSAGLLLLLRTMLDTPWSVALVLCFTLIFQILLVVSIEKKLILPIWGAAFAIEVLVLFMGNHLETEADVTVQNLILECICLAAALMAYYVVRHIRWNALVTIVMVGMLVYFAAMEMSPSKLGVTAALFCALFLLTEITGKKFSARTRKGFLYLTPLFLVSLTLVCAMPVADTPMQWVTVKKIIRYMNEKMTGFISSVENAVSDGPKTYSMAGFSTQNRLGEKVQTRKKPQITVNGKKTLSPLYLAGNIYAEYTGHNWEEAESELPYDEDEYILQAREMENWLDDGAITPEERGEVSEDHTLNIMFTGINTRSLFVPLNGENIALIHGGKLDDNASNVRLEEAMGNGFSYMLTYTEIDYSNPIFTNLIYEALEQERPTDVRTEYIFETYTQLPEELPQEISDLAEELTAECANDYDKMKALEDYLKNFTYSRNLGEIPEDEDYVVYFLFDRKEGYCTAYASALAVMGRCQGIPTRYVEGFVAARSCYYNTFSLNITTLDSHAWVEAYFPGIGWVPFDGVPGYRERLNTTWENRAALDAQLEGVLDEDDETAQDDAAKGGEMTAREVLILLVEILLLLCVAVLFILALFAARNRRRRRRYEKLPDAEKMKVLMQKTLEFGVLYHLPMQMGETLQEYELRLEGKLDTESQTFAVICGWYEAMRFGNGSVSDARLQAMEQYLKQLEGKYLANCRKNQKLFYKMR